MFRGIGVTSRLYPLYAMPDKRLGHPLLGFGVGLRTVHYDHILRDSAGRRLVRDYLRELHGLSGAALGTSSIRSPNVYPDRDARGLIVHWEQ